MNEECFNRFLDSSADSEFKKAFRRVEAEIRKSQRGQHNFLEAAVNEVNWWISYRLAGECSEEEIQSLFYVYDSFDHSVTRPSWADDTLSWTRKG